MEAAEASLARRGGKVGGSAEGCQRPDDGVAVEKLIDYGSPRQGTDDAGSRGLPWDGGGEFLNNAIAFQTWMFVL